MIVKEFYKTRNDGVNLYRTYSNEGYSILQNETGVEYSEAIDVENAPYTYCETNNTIVDEEGTDEATETDYQNALEDLGVNLDEKNNIE